MCTLSWYSRRIWAVVQRKEAQKKKIAAIRLTLKNNWTLTMMSIHPTVCISTTWCNVSVTTQLKQSGCDSCSLLQQIIISALCVPDGGTAVLSGRRRLPLRWSGRTEGVTHELRPPAQTPSCSGLDGHAEWHHVPLDFNSIKRKRTVAGSNRSSLWLMVTIQQKWSSVSNESIYLGVPFKDSATPRRDWGHHSRPGSTSNFSFTCFSRPDF